MKEQLALLPGYLSAHLQISLVALLAGAALSIPLGVLVTRRRSLEGAVLGAASVIQTIPGLALLAIMVPALAALSGAAAALGVSLRSIGYLPAVLALTLYSVLPILRNTVTGIAGVSPALIEAARGVGMTPAQQLFRVELPLALPVIVAGLRTAAVWVVGTATLSTPVGATSLGNFIFSGLQTRNDAAVVVGCLAAAGLALLLDQGIRLLEVALRTRRRALLGLVLAAFAGLILAVGWSFAAERRAGPRPVQIGAKAFTEQYILSELIGQWIERRTGQRGEVLHSLGSKVVFEALRAGDIDLYVDYSGTIWATLMKRKDLPARRGELLDEVRRWLLAEHGIVLVGAFGFENTYALALRAAEAQRLGIRRISDLAKFAERLEIGGDYEFFQRAEWKALRESYGLAFRRLRSMDPALMYQAAAGGEVDVISGYSTDGRIAALDLAVLEDDRGVIPPYDAILLASPGFARTHSAALRALGELSGAIDAAAMQRMNFAVDSGGRAPAEVARNFAAQLEAQLKKRAPAAE